MGPAIVLVLLIPLIGDLLWAFSTFDELFRLESRQYSGSEIGTVEPEASSSMPDGSAYPSWPENHRTESVRGWKSITWLFSTPEWVRVDPQAGMLLHRYRILVAIWNIVGLALIIGILAWPG